MAEISSFFNSKEHDRRYFAEDFARHLKKYFTNGIFNNELAVIANNDMSITIKSGGANIEGYRYTNTADLIKEIEVADGVLKRIDNVVLRLDLTNRLISAQIIKGTYSDTPSAPALVRTTTTYDIKLAEITVNNGITSITQSAIKDTRPDTNLCGIVASTVKTLDTTDIYNQLYTKYNELIDEHNNEWNSWYTLLKNSIDTWFENVQQQYSDKLDEFEKNFNAWFDTLKFQVTEDTSNLEKFIQNSEDNYNTWFNKTKQDFVQNSNEFKETNEESFNAWFNTIKNKLGSDVAGELQNQIDGIVNNLINYYKRSETYSKEEINAIVKATVQIEKVDTLPTENMKTNTIYLVPKSTDVVSKTSEKEINLIVDSNQEKITINSNNLKEENTTKSVKTIANTNNSYDEYIYINNDWEFIGSTEVDLSNYVTIQLLNETLNNYINSDALDLKLQSYAKTTDLPTKLTDLQNDFLIPSNANTEEDAIAQSASTTNKFFYWTEEE